MTFCWRAAVGKEGLSICRREGVVIDLVLSDCNMPDGNGIIVAEELITVCPSIPMIFMSGNLAAHDEVTGRGFLCLQKPFDLSYVEETVRSFTSRG